MAKSATNKGAKSPDGSSVEPTSTPWASTTKTPFFQAMNALRYQRQEIMKDLKRRTNRTIVCYVASLGAPIHRDDTINLVDLLHNIEPGSNIDFLLHTGGGDVDAAEKLITMLRRRVNQAELRLIVPDFAKSAGTLIGLGTDSIVMSDTSELGPIDPQMLMPDGNGGTSWQPVQAYIDAYEAHAKALKADPNDVTAALMLNKLDPTLLKRCETVRERARTFAEKQLRLGMFRNSSKNVTLTAKNLLDTKRWQSHGQMISWEDAQDPTVNLNVTYLAADDPIWQEYWRLYCMQRLAITDDQKLFESDFASTTMN